jgi:hypothetical protein
MRRLRDVVLARLRRLPEDEGGQSAMFAVLTLMLLVIVIAYGYNVGMTASQRVRMQNAADAAAYSGAVVEANGLAAIAWLNNCETYLHSKLQQHMLDVVMYSTAGGIAEWGRYVKDTYDNAEHDDRDTYEPYPFLTPWYFIPIPFVVDNTGPLETRVLGRMTDLDGASRGYPPDEEFAEVFDTRTFRRLLPETTLQDILDQLMDNFGDLDFGENNPLSGMMDTVKDMLSDAASDIGDAVMDAVVGAVREAIGDLFRNYMRYLITGGGPRISIGKIMKEIMSNIVDELKDAIKEIVNEFLENIIDEIGGRFEDFITDLMNQILDFQVDEWATFEEVYGEDLYERLESKYDGVTVQSPPELLRATKDHVLSDATRWIADAGSNRRPGELWIRQLSLTAAALAKALPGMVRNEVVHTVAINAPRGTMIAIHPAPQANGPNRGSPYTGGAGSPMIFDGRPALAGSDAAAGRSFFRYDAYPIDYETNRFLAESRRQAYEQGYRYVRRKDSDDADVADEYEIKGAIDSIITKPEILYWWDELEGVVRDDGEVFQGNLRCWNKRDRIIEEELPAEGEEWDLCPIGYAPGRTPGSPTAKPDDAENAADGHWHVRHGHAHGEDCTRTWGGFEIGIFGPLSLRCFWKCLGLAIGGVNHHMQYLNHQSTYHWDGLVEGEDNKHVYCEVAVTNTRTARVTDDSGATQAEFKSQFPDLVPGLRFTKICWMCKWYWFSYVFFMLPDCACTHCPPPTRILLDPEPDQKPRPRHHNTAGDAWGFFFEYMPFPPAAWPLDNWPEEDGNVHTIFSTGPFVQYFPGHFWTRADWEGFFSGDKYYYDADHYLSMPTDTRESVTGIGIPDALFDMMPESLRYVFHLGAEMAGRVQNWKSRKGHHGFMVCPLCMSECPVCGKDHYGLDWDNDEQVDVGMNYAEVLGGSGQSSNGHDSATGDYGDYALGTDINAQNDMECDRFHRKTFAPRTDTGTPRPELAPTVMLTENFFRHGVTVALWAPHRTYFFQRFFGERTGYVAVATARAGFIEPADDPEYVPTSPRQIITGIGEPREDGTAWDLTRIRDDFLAFRSNKYVRSNLYYPEWGAKLVPTRYAILPASAGNRKRFWREIGAAKCYTATGDLTQVPLRELITQGGDADRWDDFVNDYVEWMN